MEKDFLDVLGQKIVDTTEAIADITKETAHVAQLKYNLAIEKDNLEQHFAELGKLYFTKYIRSLDDDFAPLVAEIYSTQLKIDHLRAEIKKIKGIKNCEHCHAELHKDAAFCSACGTKVK